MLTADPAPFADIGPLIRQALQAYLPPARITVAEHAAANRWLDNRGGGYVGRWTHDEAPYLIEPMEALTNPDYLTVAVPGPGRSGKTAVAENWFLHAVDADPADMLWYEPIDDTVEAYVKAVINPMIEAHDILRRRQGPNPVDRSLHFKRFTSGMRAEFLAMTGNNTKNKSAGRIVVDEMDAAPDALGDIYELADQRRQTFGRESKIYACSHPDLATGLDPARWTRGIMGLYARSTRCCWYWPCPECNDFSSPAPIAERVMELTYPEDGTLDDIRDQARLLCPSCGSLIADNQRRAMNLDGKWIGLGESIAPDGTVTGERINRDIAGYWIVGLMSPFIIGGIGTLAAAKVAEERKSLITGDDKPLRLVMARRFGLPYSPRRQAGQVDAETLAARAEDRPLGIVPEGVRFLTAFADVQAARFEVLVRGWGVNGESWVIDMRRIVADTGVSPAAWDDLLRWMTTVSYPLAADPSRAMRIRGIGYDSAGAPGTTQQAYAAWRRLRAGQKVRFLGKADGRDLWTVMPLKGASGPNAPRVQVVYPTSKRKDRDARATGAEPVLIFNPNAFKDDLAGQLARAEPGDWYIHHPAALRGAWPAIGPETEGTRHAWFEQIVAERPDARGRWARVTEGGANEALDLHVGTHVLAELHGLSRIKWAAPPSWAAPIGGNNPMIGPAMVVEAPDRPGGPEMIPLVAAPAAATPPVRRRTLGQAFQTF